MQGANTAPFPRGISGVGSWVNVLCHITAAVVENFLELGGLIVARRAHTECLISFLPQGTVFQQEGAAGGAGFSPSHCWINRTVQWVL